MSNGVRFSKTPLPWNECAMTPIRRAVAAGLWVCADNKTHKTFVGVEWLAGFAGASKRSIKGALTWLEARGFITRRKRYHKTDEITLNEEGVVDGNIVRFDRGSIEWADDSLETVQLIQRMVRNREVKVHVLHLDPKPKGVKVQMAQSQGAPVAHNLDVLSRLSKVTSGPEQLNERLRELGLTDAQLTEVKAHPEDEIRTAFDYVRLAPGRNSISGSFMWATREPNKAKASVAKYQAKADPSRMNGAAHRKTETYHHEPPTGPTPVGTAAAAKIAAKLNVKE